MHGGNATKTHQGNQNARTHGIYSAHLTDEEREIWHTLELGAVDEELRLTRIRLMRALARENEFGNTLELESEKVEPVEVEGKPLEGVEKITRNSKVRDYNSVIDRLTARIESLERTRAELLKNNPPQEQPVAKIEIEVVGGRASASAPNDGAPG
jgi:hypothetical protein